MKKGPILWDSEATIIWIARIESDSRKTATVEREKSNFLGILIRIWNDCHFDEWNEYYPSNELITIQQLIKPSVFLIANYESFIYMHEYFLKLNISNMIGFFPGYQKNHGPLNIYSRYSTLQCFEFRYCKLHRHLSGPIRGSLLGKETC